MAIRRRGSRSDLGMFDDQKREALVGALFNAFKEGRLTDWIELAIGSRNLWHPRLEEQICPYLTDHSEPQVLREVAVDTAEGARLVGVQDSLVGIALDPSAPTQLRANAILAVAEIGDEQAKLDLKSLVTGTTAGDSNQEIMGAALRALWPDSIGIDELGSILEPPRPGFMGLYWMFLSSEFAERCTVGDLPAILDAQDWKRGSCTRSSTEPLQLELHEQARTTSDSGLEVRAFVLDASYSP